MKFSVHVAVARSCDDNAVCYILPVLWRMRYDLNCVESTVTPNQPTLWRTSFSHNCHT